MSLFTELKRRNVFRVAIAYAVVAWLVMQVADVMIDNIGAPPWLFKFIVLLLAIGLPVALVFAWAFELTPEGLKREKDVDRTQSIASQTGRKLDRVIIVVLVLAVAYLFWESRGPGQPLTVPADSHAKSPAQRDSAANAQAPDAERPARAHSIAILPFLNMSPDPDQDYFSDGVTEEIINAVVKIPGVQVPARTSVFGYKGHQGDVRKIGQELGVAYVLEGSVRTQGDQVRVTAQLIKVDDGFHVWSEAFDRRVENIFAVQEEIAAAIAEQLVGELGEGVRTVPNRTSNMLAYDLYLQGRAALRQRQDASVDLLTRATEADPEFAPAWAALAIAYQSVPEDNAKASEAADKALALDPDNVDALDAKGSALRDLWHWREAETYYDRALAIDPNSAELLEDYAEFLAYTGRMREALQATSRGMAIDHALLPLVFAHLEALVSNGRAGEAFDLAVETVENHPDKTWMWSVMVPVWLDPANLAAGRKPPPWPRSDPTPDAPDWVRKWLEMPERIRGGGLTAEDIALLKTWLESASRPGVGEARIEASRTDTSGFRAMLMAAGEFDFVLAADLAMVEAGGPLNEWNWTPFARPLREHPDFQRYLQQAGLIDYWDKTEWPDWCRREAEGVVKCR